MIEFAIAFPIFILFFLGIIEIALINFGNSVVQNMLNQAARQGMIGCERGEIVGGISDIQRNCEAGFLVDPVLLKSSITQKTFGLVDACSDRFDLRVGPVTTSFDASSMSGIDLGQGDQVVAYYASYDWPVLSPMLQLETIFGNVIEFEYATVVRNERFGRIAGRLMPNAGC